MDTALDLLSQFTGTGGGTAHALVNFGVAAIFWSLLLVMSRVAPDRKNNPVAQWMSLGFALALAREVVMLVVKTFEAYGTFSNEEMHLVFPPLEHALSNLGLALIAGSYVASLSGDYAKWKRFTRASVTGLLAIYVATATWWFQHSWQRPEIRFGQTWTDWAFRIATSLILGVAIVGVLRTPASKIRAAVAASLTLFFANEFLKIIDMAFGEQYEATFATIRHTLFLAALPLLAFAYIKDEANKLSTVFDDLENRVEERTIALASAVEELEEANGQLLTLSTTDRLTSVGNRAAFDDELQVLWEHAQRSNKSLSVLIVDLDSFKAINDSHGHAVGDTALKWVARILSEQAQRRNDFVARIGGDEFAVLLPGSDGDHATAIGEAIRSHVAAVSESTPVTVSVGVASIRPTAFDSPEELLVHADQALYEAKRLGRNSVFSHAQTEQIAGS